jgi:hypothetical protein
MQSVDDLHATGAICSLAAEGGVSVKGGNWQIYEQFVERSAARVFLKTEVNLSAFTHPCITHSTPSGGWHTTTLRQRLDCRDTG